MKIIIVFFLSFIFLSCSAQKVEYDVINDFLDNELLLIPHDTVYVIEEPLDNIKLLEIYEQALKEKKLTNESPTKKVWVYPELEFWPLTDLEVNKIRNNLSKDITPELWKDKNFKDKSYIIYRKEILRSKEFKIKHTSNNIILNLSKPIFSDDNTHALFQFYPSSIIGGSAYELSGVVLMKKEYNRWNKVAVLMPAVYY